MQISFIGGGNMANALIGGLIKTGMRADLMQVVELNAELRAALQQRFGVIPREQLNKQTTEVDVILLAVKPQQLKAVAKQLAPLLSTQLVISIAAGIRSDTLSSWLGGYRRLVRVMPNTPALVGCGMAGLYALPEVDQAARVQTETILKAVGQVLWLEQEMQMDALTAVSGSGPAYVFYFMEAMQQAAQDLGFTPQEARLLMQATFSGAIKLAEQSEENSAELRTRVTSKGGTTERALHYFDQQQLKSHIMKGIQAAAVRSRELGEELAH